jgi:hypothetical protein
MNDPKSEDERLQSLADALNAHQAAAKQRFLKTRARALRKNGTNADLPTKEPRCQRDSYRLVESGRPVEFKWPMRFVGIFPGIAELREAVALGAIEPPYRIVRCEHCGWRNVFKSA